MRPISSKNKKIISSEDFYLACCLCGRLYPEMHHVLYMGRQLDHIKFIVPACGWIVDGKKDGCHHKVDTDVRYKHYFEWIVTQRLTENEKKGFPSDFVGNVEYLYQSCREIQKYPIDLVLSGKMWTVNY